MKALFTKKEIESYNKIAAYLNAQSEAVSTQSEGEPDAEFENDITNRIPCVRIGAGGIVEFYNCKTGEKIK